MSRFTPQRRWAAQQKRKRVALMTENGITPDEAREALTAIMLQAGVVVEKILDYCPLRDRFIVEGRRDWFYDADGNLAGGKLVQCTVYGETVAKTVKKARDLAGTLGKPLIRPSDAAQMAAQERERLRISDLIVPS
jgi:hypothetical protein